MVSDLHLSLGNAQVEAAQDLQFAVRSAHVSAADRKILLSRRQRSLQVSLHVVVLELAGRRKVRSKLGKNTLKNAIHLGVETKVNIRRRRSGSYQHAAEPGTMKDQSGGL